MTIDYLPLYFLLIIVGTIASDDECGLENDLKEDFYFPF